MLTEHSVAAAARAAGILALGGHARYVPATGSTNADLISLARAGTAPAWTVLVAGHQRGGRGRLGRTWDSPPGTSLLASVVLPPPSVPQAGLPPLAAAVAMADAVRSACRVDAACKWPNDLMVGDRKLAGILAEGTILGETLEQLVVGAGVNLTQTEDELPAPDATSVRLEGGRPDAGALLAAYLSDLAATYRPGEGGFARAVLDAYRARCDTIGREVRVLVSTRAVVEGLAEGIDERGGLRIRTASGPVTVTSGEVVHLRTAPPSW
jgi:BirA family biotin operon repressor/biotin-[acetyl-CoA-carboxylase] ligase